MPALDTGARQLAGPVLFGARQGELRL